MAGPVYYNDRGALVSLKLGLFVVSFCQRRVKYCELTGFAINFKKATVPA
jgi:hypothetical protein